MQPEKTIPMGMLSAAAYCAAAFRETMKIWQSTDGNFSIIKESNVTAQSLLNNSEWQVLSF